jgi:HK97 family phage major capsid protein
LADALPASLHSQFAVVVQDISALIRGEGKAKTVSQATLAGASLVEKLAAAIITVSDDLVRFSPSGLTVLENSLRVGVAAATDKEFVDGLIALTTAIPSSGNFFQDLRTAMAAAGSGSNSKFHLITSPATAQALALASTTDGAVVFPGLTANGGVGPAGIVVNVSDALTDTAILLDASALAANADPVQITTARSATLEMDTDPSMATAGGSPVTSTESNVVSMFQVNGVAIRVERVYGWELLRASAAQSFSGVGWGLVGSPPA